MLIGVVMSRPKKSASENWTLRLASRHRSTAFSTVDLPLSPGPIRQLMPGVGHQASSWMPRKLAISIFLIRCRQAHHRPQISCSKDIHLGFKALAQTQIVCTNLEPSPWLLVKIQSTANLDDPSVIQSDFAVMDVRVELHL